MREMGSKAILRRIIKTTLIATNVRRGRDAAVNNRDLDGSPRSLPVESAQNPQRARQRGEICQECENKR